MEEIEPLSIAASDAAAQEPETRPSTERENAELFPRTASCSTKRHVSGAVEAHKKRKIIGGKDTGDEAAAPSQVLDKYWIRCSTAEQANQPHGGKWMMFVDKWRLDVEWQVAQEHYLAGDLVGIYGMKCSTTKENPRASDRGTGVIILYCGPETDEERVMLIGQNLLHWMKYTPATGYMYYKSDYQTMLGTRATGVKRNWLYRVHTSAAKRVTIAELPVFSPSNEPIDPENNEQEKAIEKAWKGGPVSGPVSAKRRFMVGAWVLATHEVQE